MQSLRGRGKSRKKDDPKGEFQKAANQADTALRRKEISQWGKAGIRTTEIVITLVEALYDKREIIRMEAAETLGKIGDKRDVERLEERLKVEDSEFVKYYIIQAMGEAREREPPEEPEIEEPTSEETEEKEFGEELAGLGPGEDDDFEVGEMDEPDDTEHEFGEDESAEEVDGPEPEVETPVEEPETTDTGDEEPEVEAEPEKATAVEVPEIVIEEPPETEAAMIKRHILGLKNHAVEIRRNSARELGVIGAEEAVKPLIEALKKPEKEETVRKAIVFSLGMICSERVVSVLIHALKDKKSSVLVIAITALEGSKDKRAVKPLLKLIKHKKDVVRSKVAKALGEIGDETAVPALLDRIKKDKNANVRSSSVWAIGVICNANKGIKNKKAAEILKDRLSDGSPDVRRKVIHTLALMGEKSAADSFKGILMNDPEPSVKQIAALSLGTLGDKSAVPFLTSMLKSEKDGEVLKDIGYALNQLK